MVSQKLLDELGTIIKEDHGIELQKQVVAEIGSTLISFFESLARIEYQSQNEEETE